MPDPERPTMDIDFGVVERFLAAIDDWTTEDLRRDPTFGHLIERLASNEGDRMVLAYAAYHLDLHDELPDFEPPTRVDDWQGALLKLLEHPAPVAHLRFRPLREQAKRLNNEGELDIHNVSRAVISREHLPDELMNLGLDSSQREVALTPLKAWMFVVQEWAPRGPFSVDRRDVVAYPSRYDQVVLKLTSIPFDYPRSSVRSEPDAWRQEAHEVLEKWTALFTSSPYSRSAQISVHRGAPLFSEDAVEPEVWGKADEWAMLYWWRIAKALEAPDFVTLHDGRVALRIADGAAVVLDVRKAEDEDVSASIAAAPDRYGSGIALIEERKFELYRRRDSSFAAFPPENLELRGEGVAVEVHPVSSHLLF